MDSTESRKRTMIYAGWKLSLIVSIILIAFFFAGYFAGRWGKHERPAIVNSPTTAAPFAYACDHGLRVYTTSQGGIAVYAGGKECP